MIEFIPPPEEKSDVSRETLRNSQCEFRELTAEEIATVHRVFQERGAEIPNPAASTFVGAVKDDKVIGFIVLQLQIHAEPMWIDPAHRDLFKPLVNAAEESILRRCGPSRVYLFAESGHHTKLAQLCGMQMEPWVVLTKVVVPKPNLGMMEAPPEEPIQIEEVETPESVQ